MQEGSINIRPDCSCRLGAHLSDAGRNTRTSRDKACVLVPILVREARGHTLEKRIHLPYQRQTSPGHP